MKIKVLKISKEQRKKATPTFTGGKTTVNGKEETVEIDTTKPAKLVDPTTGQPTDETTVKVPNEGTYTIDPKTGEVTFTPEPNFTGKLLELKFNVLIRMVHQQQRLIHQL